MRRFLGNVIPVLLHQASYDKFYYSVHLFIFGGLRCYVLPQTCCAMTQSIAIGLHRLRQLATSIVTTRFASIQPRTRNMRPT